MKRVVFEAHQPTTIIMYNRCSILSKEYGVRIGCDYFITSIDEDAIQYRLLNPFKGFMTFFNGTVGHDTSGFFKQIIARFPEAEIFQFENVYTLFEWIGKGE